MASLWTGFWGRILPAPLLSLSAYGLCNCALGLCGMFAAQSVSPATLLSCGSLQPHHRAWGRWCRPRGIERVRRAAWAAV